MNNLRTLTYISLAIGVTAFHYSSLMLQPGLPCQSTSNQRYLLARPKSKWDLLTDEDDDDLDIDSTSSVVPTDMTYIESNIKRQLSNYDKLYEIGGDDVIHDVWVRADGEKEWWLVGKIARVSGEIVNQEISRIS